MEAATRAAALNGYPGSMYGEYEIGRTGQAGGARRNRNTLFARRMRLECEWCTGRVVGL